MHLANDRALATAQVLVQSGVLWEQLRLVSCADNERATPRATDPEGHRNNQRAEIVVVRKDGARRSPRSPKKKRE